MRYARTFAESSDACGSMEIEGSSYQLGTLRPPVMAPPTLSISGMNEGIYKRTCMQNSVVAFLHANDEKVARPTRACVDS